MRTTTTKQQYNTTPPRIAKTRDERSKPILCVSQENMESGAVLILLACQGFFFVAFIIVSLAISDNVQHDLQH